MEEITLHIKNMICPRCITVLKYEFENSGVEVKGLALGLAKINLPESVSMEAIETMLQKHGFALIKDEDELLVEQIKQAVRDLLENSSNSKNPKIKNSTFISKKIGKSYRTLSEVFSIHEATTIEKYLIDQRVEAVKLLIRQRELNVSEIAAELEYSSVQHLSGQFKDVTGMSVREYKKLINPEHKI